MQQAYKTVLLLLLALTAGCASIKIKDVSYSAPPAASGEKEPKLNIFLPKDEGGKNYPVMIFIHGGNWNSGNKDTYVLMGRNFAKKGVVTVIPDYTVSPDADYDLMTRQVAQAINWTKANIERYHGDPARIFVSGHSAGGHLAALAVMNPKYGVPDGTVSGLLLNDAAGLDIYYYLKQQPPTQKHDYLATWTNDEEKWKDATPLLFIDKETPPVLLYTGKNTFDMIKQGNRRFLDALHEFQPQLQPIIISKNHFSMVIQYFFGGSRRYPEALDFIERNSGAHD